MNDDIIPDEVWPEIEKKFLASLITPISEYTDEFFDDLQIALSKNIARKYSQKISDKNIIRLININSDPVFVEDLTQFLLEIFEDQYPDTIEDNYFIDNIKIIKKYLQISFGIGWFVGFCESESPSFTSSQINDFIDSCQKRKTDRRKEIILEIAIAKKEMTNYLNNFFQNDFKYDFKADFQTQLNIVTFSFKPIGKKSRYKVVVISKSGDTICDMILDENQTSFEFSTESLTLGHYIAFLKCDENIASIISFSCNKSDKLLCKSEPALSFIALIDPLVNLNHSLSSVNFLNRDPLSFNNIHFISEKTRKTIDTSLELAKRNVPILITGGPGSGKKLFVQMIHDHSENKKQKITRIEISAKDQDSHLEKLYKSTSGTIVLGNVHELTNDNQNHLLRFINSCPSKVRLIFVSNENLSDQDCRRNIRIQDSFFHEISRHSVEIPYLKDRGFDFLILIWHFVQKSPQRDKYSIMLLRLMDFIYSDFPGNVNDIKWYCSEKINEKLLLFDSAGFKPMSEDLIKKLEKDGWSKGNLERFVANANKSCNIKELIDKMLQDKDKYAKQYSKYDQVKILLELVSLDVEFSEQAKTDKKLRPSQRHKLECRKVARNIWLSDPSITIYDVIQKDEINKIFDGKYYAEKTIRNWINDLCPDRSPGRRPKKLN